jgi:hypothetical protein
LLRRDLVGDGPTGSCDQRRQRCPSSAGPPAQPPQRRSLGRSSPISWKRTNRWPCPHRGNAGSRCEFRIGRRPPGVNEGPRGIGLTVTVEPAELSARSATGGPRAARETVTGHLWRYRVLNCPCCLQIVGSLRSDTCAWDGATRQSRSKLDKFGTRDYVSEKGGEENALP